MHHWNCAHGFVLRCAATVTLMAFLAPCVLAADDHVFGANDGGTLRPAAAEAESTRSTDGASSPPSQVISPGGAGQVVYVDPVTGEILPHPPEGTLGRVIELHRRAQEMLSHSEAGLVQKPAPGGGVMVDLQGRFQVLTVATMTDDGAVRTHCLGGVSNSTHAHAHGKSGKARQ